MSRESDANEVRIEALATLDDGRAKLHSWRFLQALKTAPDQDKTDAAQLMLDVAITRQTLAAAILSEIVEELEAQEADLKRATTAMNHAVTSLDKTRTVIDAIGKVVEVIGKIVSLV